jgi:hypothetical protein
MKYPLKIVVAWLVVLLSGCATSSREQAGSTASAPAKMAKNNASQGKSGTEEHMVCEVERTVGSWIPETVCRAVEQTERNRRRTQDAFNEAQSTPIVGRGTR